jgi:hypothetical protein
MTDKFAASAAAHEARRVADAATDAALAAGQITLEQAQERDETAAAEWTAALSKACAMPAPASGDWNYE